MQQRALVAQADPTNSVQARCQALGLSRSSFYYQPCGESAYNLHLMRLLDKEFTDHHFKGVLGLRDHLRLAGHAVNEKRVRRLVRLMGHEPVYPKPRLSVLGQGVTRYLYLLRDRSATGPNEVWSTDITYIPMAKGFLYLAAVLDWHSRYVLSWQLSHSLDVGFCLQILANALQMVPAPHIFNPDLSDAPASPWAVSSPAWSMNKPCWPPAAASAEMAGAAPRTTPLSSASGVPSNGSTSTSTRPTTATTCTSNYRRTLPTIITADRIKA